MTMALFLPAFCCNLFLMALTASLGLERQIKGRKEKETVQSDKRERIISQPTTRQLKKDDVYPGRTTATVKLQAGKKASKKF